MSSPWDEERPTGLRSLVEDGRVKTRLIRSYRLRVHTADGQEQELEFAQPVIRVGSRHGNDVVLEDPTVSRFHFELSVGEHGFRLRDLGSTNGTFVDEYRANDIHLKPGSRIVAGGSLIDFEPLAEETEVALADRDVFGPLVGHSTKMRELFAMLQRIAPTNATVLVEGESGTGKELVAEAVHRASLRAAAPFVVCDCAAVPPNLLESEFFGHEKGAFTGAAAQRMGRFEQAHGGTLFLDEIGELPRDLQPKLLRALEQREIRPVGSNRVIPVDIRVIAATNRDMAREVNRGAFRDDLYYRLAVVRLTIPPLREHPDDIRILVASFVRAAWSDDPARAEALLASIDDDNWESLEKHLWPGNVRELRNAVERGVALSGDGASRGIPIEDGPALRVTNRPDALEGGETPYPPFDLDRPYQELRRDLLSRFEDAYVHGLLSRHEGKILRAAAAAGLDRTHFKRILRRHPKE